MGDLQKEFDEVEKRASYRRSKRKWLRRVSLILGVIIAGLVGAYGFGWIYFVTSAESGSGMVYVWLYGVIVSLIFLGTIFITWKFWN